MNNRNQAIDIDRTNIISLEDLSNQELPSWCRSIVQQFKEITSLPENWDSYNAKRVSETSVLTAIDLLHSLIRHNTPEPSIVPTKSGHVQIEWHVNGIDLEFEVNSPTKIPVYYHDGDPQNEWEGTLDTNLTKLSSYIQRLSA